MTVEIPLIRERFKQHPDGKQTVAERENGAATLRQLRARVAAGELRFRGILRDALGAYGIRGDAATFSASQWGKLEWLARVRISKGQQRSGSNARPRLILGRPRRKAAAALDAELWRPGQSHRPDTSERSDQPVAKNRPTRPPANPIARTEGLT